MREERERDRIKFSELYIIMFFLASVWPGKARNVEGQNIGPHYGRKEILREKKIRV